LRPTRIRELKMKKKLAILVAIMAVTISVSAQNSDTTQVKLSDLKIPASKLARDSTLSSDKQIIPDSTDFIIDCGCPSSYRTNPLLLVDGLEVSSEVFARLNPNDVKSFSVIKDAKALEMYGKRGVNGVIVITSNLSKKHLHKMIKEAKKNEKK